MRETGILLEGPNMYISSWIVGLGAAVIIILFALNNGKRKELETQKQRMDSERQKHREDKENLEEEIKALKTENTKAEKEIKEYQIREAVRDEMLGKMQSNLDAFPYLAGIMADYKTAELWKLEKQLDWGHDKKRLKQVQSIRALHLEANEAIEKAKEAEYQLEYLLKLYPELEEIIEKDYKELDLEVKTNLPDQDPVRPYLSKEEWAELDEVTRNQLALDRYVASHKKTNWQIGRDYENYIGYTYEKQENATVEYTGSKLRLEDLGRDLIVHSAGKTRIVQCKYWSQNKQIHEKHIFQLFGTVILYCMEHNVSENQVKGVLITNITLSETAKQIAERLGILYKEEFPMGDYPRIKCNIGKDKEGNRTRIYHLPMDQQYDNVVINQTGEFFAFTVQEAVEKGFRRAFKWYG